MAISSMQKSLAFVVTTPPNSNLTTTAIKLVTAALNDIDINVVGVFFYQDGVLNAAKHLSIPSDEFQTLAQWRMLNQQHNVPLYLCISAGEKRGLSDELENNHSNLDECFVVSGLGELVELTAKADKVVQL